MPPGPVWCFVHRSTLLLLSSLAERAQPFVHLLLSCCCCRSAVPHLALEVAVHCTEHLTRLLVLKRGLHVH
jgi:hypothetical protein